MQAAGLSLYVGVDVFPRSFYPLQLFGTSHSFRTASKRLHYTHTHTHTQTHIQAGINRP